MDYVLEVFTQAVASTDPCRTAFSVLVPLLLSIVLGTLFVPRVLLLSRKRKLYDIPDQRKVHNRPIPRLGGVTFFPVLLISFCLTVGLWMLLELYSNPSHVDAYFPRFILLSVGMMALFLTGVADDRNSWYSFWQPSCSPRLVFGSTTCRACFGCMRSRLGSVCR